MESDTQNSGMGKANYPVIFLSALLLFAASFALFHRTSSFDFAYDDYYTVVTDNDLQDFSPSGLNYILKKSIYKVNYHPIRKAFYSFIYGAGGLTPADYHLANVLINAINAALVFFICIMILSSRFSNGRDNSGENDFVKISASALAALIFVFHPLHVEPVAYISGLKETLSSLFSLASLAFFVRLRTGGKNKVPSWSFHASFIFFIAACLTRPSYVFLPIFMLAFDLLFPGAARRSPAIQRFQEYMFFLIVMGVIVILNYALGIRSELVNQEAISNFLASASLVVKSLYFYISKTLFPSDLSVIYDFKSIYDINIFKSSLCCAAVILAMASCLRKAPLISAGIFFYLISLAPSIYIIPIFTPPSDSVAYISIAGLSLAAADIISRLLSSGAAYKKGMAILIPAILSIALCARTVERIPVWASNLTLWKATLDEHPDSSIALTGMGDALLAANDIKSAGEYYQKSLDVDPFYYKTYIGLSNLYIRQNDTQASRTALKRGFQRNIYNLELQYYYGVSLYNTGNFSEAVRILIYIENSYPNFMEVRKYIKATLRVARNSMEEKDFLDFIERIKLPASIDYK